MRNGRLAVRHFTLNQRILALIPRQVCVGIFLLTDRLLNSAVKLQVRADVSSMRKLQRRAATEMGQNETTTVAQN